MVIPLDLAVLLDTLEQDVRADHIVHGEFVRIDKAQVHVRVGSEMEHGVDVVLLQAFDHVGSDGGIAVEEVEVSRLLRLQQACIVERAAIVEFVEGHLDSFCQYCYTCSRKNFDRSQCCSVVGI